MKKWLMVSVLLIGLSICLFKCGKKKSERDYYNTLLHNPWVGKRWRIFHNDVDERGKGRNRRWILK